MKPTPGFATFPTWDDVLAHVASGADVHYHAPLNHRPVLIKAAVKGKGVRVTPYASDCDPFTADAGHLERFKRRI